MRCDLVSNADVCIDRVVIWTHTALQVSQLVGFEGVAGYRVGLEL